MDKSTIVTFTGKENRKSYMKCHQNSRPFQCAVCANMYTNKENLGEHINVHYAQVFELINIIYLLSEHMKVHYAQVFELINIIHLLSEFEGTICYV